MKSIPDLLRGYGAFRNNQYAHQRELFDRLSHRQQPAIMIIACADSRADPSMIFSASPGELFIVRNVANLVPPFEEGGVYHGTAAALEFAVTQLHVQHIVVMGHARCGGIAACLDAGQGVTTGKFIGPWVAMLDDVREQVQANSPSFESADLQERMEKAAIGRSLDAIAGYPFANEALIRKDLELHGAWFSIATGELHWRDRETGGFKPVEAGRG